MDSSNTIIRKHKKVINTDRYVESKSVRRKGEICRWCNLPATKKCERCRKVRYCNKECQVNDWERHKRIECGGYEIILSKAEKFVGTDRVLLLMAFISRYIELRKNEYRSEEQTSE